MQGRFISTIAGLVLTAGMLLPSAAGAQVSLSAGDLIRTDGSQSVYYFGADGKRYVFPNEKTYFTWYANFDSVKTISNDQLAGIPIGGNVTYRPGTRMVKIVSDPKVYAVSKNGILRPIASEAVAAALYGTAWNTMIDDVPDAFFVNYRTGAEISDAADFDKTRVMAGVTTINVDRLLSSPPPGFVDYRPGAGFFPASVTVAPGSKVTWIVLDSSVPTVASNPHPTHTGLPGLESSIIRMGGQYTFTFSTTGTWGYHNHNSPDQSGTVIVQASGAGSSD